MTEKRIPRLTEILAERANEMIHSDDRAAVTLGSRLYALGSNLATVEQNVISAAESVKRWADGAVDTTERQTNYSAGTTSAWDSLNQAQAERAVLVSQAEDLLRLVNDMAG